LEVMSSLAKDMTKTVSDAAGQVNKEKDTIITELKKDLGARAPHRSYFPILS
jgi:hypothetical protein